MDSSVRNIYLGAAMFLEHTSVLQPSVIGRANFVARQDGDGILIKVEESLSSRDRMEIVKVAANTVLLGQDRRPTKLERLTILHIVNDAVERNFLTAQEAFAVMYVLFGMEPSNSDDWTINNWQSSFDSVTNFNWQEIEQQLTKLREKAGRIVLRASEEIQHELADARAYWEQILQRNLDYVEHIAKSSFNDALAIYNAVADVAWQYKIEIVTARPLF